MILVNSELTSESKIKRSWHTDSEIIAHKKKKYMTSRYVNNFYTLPPKLSSVIKIKLDQV